MKRYNVSDIFTPSSPARINFIERDNINRRIVRALKTKGKQVVIYGHSGSGKTTLLENKLQQVYENHIKTNCMKGMTFENVLLDAFDQLSGYYIDERISSEKHIIDAGIKSNYDIIKTHLSVKHESSNQAKEKRIIPPQLTGPNLAKMIGEAKCCWVLEDFHKIEGDEKVKLAQLMKVFMDLSDIYPDLKIIAVGAVNTARQVVQYDTEMRRRISEIHVPLMQSAEIEKIITKGCKLLNINADKIIKEDIHVHSNGLASICHQLCAMMCEELDIYETADPSEELTFEYSHLKYAISEYLEQESDSIKQAFDKAFNLKDSHDVIHALSGMDQDGGKISKIEDDLIYKGSSYHNKKIEAILTNLMTEKHGELVKYDEDSHNYSFTDPFYKAFALAFFKDEYGSKRKTNMSHSELSSLLNDALSKVKSDFSVSKNIYVHSIKRNR